MCSKCREAKPLDRFKYHANNKDKLDSWCKDCHAEARRNKTKERKALGLCTVCGEKLDSNYTKCNKCLEGARASHKKMREEKKNKGLCVHCKKPVYKSVIVSM